MADWIAMHVNAWRAIGGVPKAIGWDALRSGVTAICRYELAINRTYQELTKITTPLSCLCVRASRAIRRR